MSLITVENTYFFSSDPSVGAKNLSDDGSKFEVRLDKPLAVPPSSIDVSVECRSANIWFTCPNISDELKNDRFYFIIHQLNVDLLEDGSPANRATNIVELYTQVIDGTIFKIQSLDLDSELYNTLGMPKAERNLYYYFVALQNAIQANYPGSSIQLIDDGVTQKIQISLGNPAFGIDLKGIFGLRNLPLQIGTSLWYVDYQDRQTIIIPKGLYGIDEINRHIHREIVQITVNDIPLAKNAITLSGNVSTQRVIITLSSGDGYTLSLDEDPALTNNIAPTLGFDNVGSVAYHTTAGDYFAGDSIAKLTRINAFFIHSDLVVEGLSSNGSGNSILTEIQISESPGSLIVYRPFNPFKLDGNHLRYGSRGLLSFRLTDERDRPVDTNGEHWSFSIVISYTIDVSQLNSKGIRPSTTYSY